MNLLITGATGFVGINTAKALSKKYNVYVLSRNYAKAERLFGNTVNILSGDITDYKSIAKAVDDMDAVVHIAGLIKSYNVRNLYLINKNGSGNVASAVKNAGLKNVVYISSLAARGPDDKKRPVSHYGYSKLLGEYEFIKYLYDADLKILRPPIMYGPYEKEFFRLFKMAKAGVMPVLGKKLFSFLYIEDLICAVEKLINFKSGRPKIYNISDGGAYSWSEAADYVFETVKKKKGLKIKIHPVSADIIAYLTYFMKDKAPFTLDKINEIKALGWTCGYENLKKDVGFEPQYSIKEGFEKTFRWYVDNEWI